MRFIHSISSLSLSFPSTGTSTSTDHHQLYSSFHQTLADRLTALLPTQGDMDSLVNLASLRQILDLLLHTEKDLSMAVSVPEQDKKNFFSLMDACNLIREGLWEVQQWIKLLHLLLTSLEQGRFSRARKALIHLNNKIINRNPAHTSNPIKDLSSLHLHLQHPSFSPLHALTFLSTFFLTTILAAFHAPLGHGASAIINKRPPSSLPWSPPFRALQDKVSEELKKRRGRGNKGGNNMLWELHCIATYVRDLTAAANLLDDNHQREEIRRLTKQLQQHVEELQKDLAPLDEQVTELYKRLRAKSMDLPLPCE